MPTILWRRAKSTGWRWLEREEQAAKWIRLTEVQRTVEGNTLTTCENIPKRRGQPEGGIEAAARELGINRMAAHRAVKVVP